MDPIENFSAEASEFSKGFLSGGISVTVIVLFFLYLWVKYPNNVKIVLSQIWHISSLIFKKWGSRRYVKTHLEGTLGKRIERINKEAKELQADRLKIVFVQNKTREAILKEKTLIIRLQRKENHSENLANIAMIYVENFLYSKLELHLDHEQKEGINLYTAKSLLMESGDSALQFFHKNYYLPAARDSEKIQEYCEKLEKIDNCGLFYSVFVQEMVFLGNKVYFKRKPEGINQEIGKFVNFLESFSKRDRGEIDIDKTFSGTNIKMGFVLVALREKHELGIPDNYIGYIKNSLLPQGIESYYILGWGSNIGFTHRVADAIGENLDSVHEIQRIKYKSIFSDGELVNALCVLFRNKNIIELQEYKEADYQLYGQ
ncbi:hypothetical protein KKC63_02980 [Patescibacteria group bacterium]|nr:hypothetical protein [Patescibacteria group bacterium]MBU4023227.1 hypothetical protein [Patescibacteria group bacterium]MBU4078139.1 hypothetical protein [Patescibacteria group bacterium]